MGLMKVPRARVEGLCCYKLLTRVHPYFLAGTTNITWFQNYHSYDDHMQFLEALQAQYSSNSEIVTSGESYEGRPITGIHIWGADGKGQNPAAVFHGTIHAREWISTMVLLLYQFFFSRWTSFSKRAFNY